MVKSAYPVDARGSVSILGMSVGISVFLAIYWCTVKYGVLNY